MLLYGDAPPSGEPTLELLRRSVPVDGDAPAAACATLDTALARWGWDAATDAANGCLTAVVSSMLAAGADAIELFAFRRAHQLDVEVHFSGADAPFHQVLATEPRLNRIDSLASLWGVRAVGDGEVVWFEFRAS